MGRRQTADSKRVSTGIGGNPRQPENSTQSDRPEGKHRHQGRFNRNERFQRKLTSKTVRCLDVPVRVCCSTDSARTNRRIGAVISLWEWHRRDRSLAIRFSNNGRVSRHRETGPFFCFNRGTGSGNPACHRNTCPSPARSARPIRPGRRFVFDRPLRRWERGRCRADHCTPSGRNCVR
ncbi:hypothetical protein Mal15_08360 [Stieleria maiorica]|uniref:Uncharacterized protein n=1 Tax=Stieleria maiorica TaxID=2795974 RepID=A0A5B9M9C1_9BACT|nr:hypothetical protein Mal15_08360 [Stieleria maiorica]